MQSNPGARASLEKRQWVTVTKSRLGYGRATAICPPPPVCVLEIFGLQTNRSEGIRSDLFVSP